MKRLLNWCLGLAFGGSALAQTVNMTNIPIATAPPLPSDYVLGLSNGATLGASKTRLFQMESLGWAVSPQNPLFFGSTAPVIAQVTDWTCNLQVGSPMPLFSAAPGTAGVVREMQILLWMMSTNVNPTTMFYAPIVSNMNWFQLNVAYDGHDYADWQIPLSVLLSYQYMNWSTNFVASNIWFRSTSTYSNVISGATNFLVLTNIVYNPGSNIVFNPKYDTDFYSVDDGNYTNSYIQFTLKYPMPYTNGMQVWLTADRHSEGDGSANSATMGCSTTYYQASLSPSANQSLRLWGEWRPITPSAGITNKTGYWYMNTNTFTQFGASSNTAGGNLFNVGDQLYLAATDVLGPWRGGWPELIVVTTNIVDGTNGFTWAQQKYATNPPLRFAALYTTNVFAVLDPYYWLKRPAGKSGYLASVFGASSQNTMDFNPMIMVNGDVLPSVFHAGTEDMFGSAFAFRGQWQGLECGIVSGCYSTNNWNTMPWSGYRHYRRNPVQYTNGIVGRVNMKTAGEVHAWGTLRYEFPSADVPLYNNAMAQSYTNAATGILGDTNKTARIYLFFERLASAGLTNAFGTNTYGTAGGLMSGFFLGTNYNTNNFPLVDLAKSNTTTNNLSATTNDWSACITNVGDGVIFAGYKLSQATNVMQGLMTNYTVIVSVAVGHDSTNNTIPVCISTSPNNNWVNNSVAVQYSQGPPQFYTVLRDNVAGAQTALPTTKIPSTNLWNNWTNLETVAMWGSISNNSSANMPMTNWFRGQECFRTNSTLNYCANKLRVVNVAGYFDPSGGGTGAPFRGKVKSVLVFSKVLSQWERQEVLAALRYLDSTGPLNYENK